MNYLLKKIDGHKISLIVACSVVVIQSLILIPNLFVLSKFAASKAGSGFPSPFSFSIGGGLLMVVFAFIFIYIFTRLFCVIFNFMAKRMGGIKLELELIEDSRIS